VAATEQIEQHGIVGPEAGDQREILVGVDTL
jgi:hypothetical protein